MKITVIGYFPQSGPMSYGSISNWIANAWKYLGHEVQKFDRSQMSLVPKKSDLYFFVDVSEDYSQTMPKDLEGIKVFWAMDVQMPGGLERTLNIAKNVDYTFCTNHEYGVQLLEKFGVESSWVPYGYDHILQNKIIHEVDEVIRVPIRYKFDVCMIGNPNSPERVQLWNLLKDKYGERAVTGQIESEKEYIGKKAGSYICISQPTEPFNTIINLRVWNALACGKLLLCKRPVIKEHAMLGLVEGKNVVYWNNFDDLIQKIDYYLENRDEGIKIALEGAKLGNKHLMPNQLRIIEQILFSKFYNKFK